MSMDGARASARSTASGKPKLECVCGRVIRSNAAIRSHQKACETSLLNVGWPLDDRMRELVFAEHGSRATGILREVSLRLGRIYLGRRRFGDKTEMAWQHYRDTFWQLVDEAAADPQRKLRRNHGNPR